MQRKSWKKKQDIRGTLFRVFTTGLMSRFSFLSSPISSCFCIIGGPGFISEGKNKGKMKVRSKTRSDRSSGGFRNPSSFIRYSFFLTALTTAENPGLFSATEKGQNFELYSFRLIELPNLYLSGKQPISSRLY